MNEGFNFADRPLLNTVCVPQCMNCPTKKGRSANPVEDSGKYGQRILIVVDQPRQEIDPKTHVPTGQWVWFGEDNTVKAAYDAYDKMRKEVPATPPFNYNEDVRVTGLLPCPSKTNMPYEHCLSRLEGTILDSKPFVIMTVGDVATGAVLRLYNKLHFPPNHTAGQYYGRTIPLSMNGWHVWLVPIPGEEEIGDYRSIEVRSVAIGIYAKLALANVYRSLPGKVAQYKQPDVKMISSPEDIIDEIDKAKTYKYVAFDYETNTLDPETIGGKILTASIAYGNGQMEPDGVAAFYLLDPKVLKAWKTMLRHKNKKIGANIKFEERWSIVNLETPVHNWYWDICVGARALDCQPGTAGLKYQTFVNFGVCGYDDDVKDYISDDESGFNKLDTLPPSKILLYNGLDSYFTYKVAKVQHHYLGIDF